MDKSLEAVAEEILKEFKYSRRRANLLLIRLKSARETPPLEAKYFAMLQPFRDAGTDADAIREVFEKALADYEARMSDAWKAADTSSITPKEFLDSYGVAAFEERYKVNPGTIGGQILITGEDPRER